MLLHYLAKQTLILVSMLHVCFNEVNGPQSDWKQFLPEESPRGRQRDSCCWIDNSIRGRISSATGIVKGKLCTCSLPICLGSVS